MDSSIALFPLSEYWWFYGLFTLFVLAMLALDLGVFHRHAHRVSFREAAAWSAVWVSLALAFNFCLYRYALWKFAIDPRLNAIEGFNPQASAWQVMLEFLSGYVVEKSLSVDNIFVFVVVFAYFAVPATYQHRVLFFGIIGALIFRAMFITLGSVLMQYHWVVVLFGAILLVTGFKLIFAGETAKINPERNIVIRLFRRFVPVTPRLHGQSFFIRNSGRVYATPLFVALLFLEATDILFAIDSVPAIFALTNEPLIVFTSNIFAILGLRAMYFMLAGAVDKFHLLKYGLAVVLMFVGLKMVYLNHAFGGKFPIEISLGVIALVLAAAVGASLLWPKRSEGSAGERGPR